MSPQSRYLLYFSQRSPFARRIRVALQKLTINYEAREINVFDPPADFTANAPLGQVPVLLIRDGKEVTALADSSAILDYLDDRYGGKIWPSESAARLKVRAASVLATGLMEDTVWYFLETQRPVPSKDWLQEFLANVDRTMDFIHHSNLRGMPWKVSDFQLTQAGYDLLIAIEYLEIRIQNLDWKTRYPDLVRFLELHRSRQDLAPTTPNPA
ncbi:MAG: glutathione S-transferase family protein [Cryobacterium sp.]|nr:glutathione S-transferase family protein [Oligoflexia bacterium]